METSSSNFLSQGLKLVSNCAMCKKPHTTEPHIIEANDERCLVHVKCGHCEHAILAVMNMQEIGVSCVGIMTDLSKEDTKVLLESREVNIDDVLSTHESLSSDGFLLYFQDAGPMASKTEGARKTSAI